MPARRALIDRSTLAFLAFAAILVALRIAGLRASPLDLYFDEAQYWAWSRTLELGYFSKPPLIAWVIAGTTALVGDAEWGVRLAAPIAHGVGALALFALGRSLYSAAAGLWAGIGWLVMPGIWLSSGVMSTDALLLPLWSVALLALWRLTVTRAWTWAIVLGLTVGLGALAKYAMLYFPLCALLAAWWTEPVRRALFNARGIAAAIVSLIVLAPNLYWNFAHSFQTVTHTAANASLSLDVGHPDELLEFLSEQMLVIGPLLLFALFYVFYRSAARTASVAVEDRYLLAFILPPLVIIMVQAFLSRANANWAAAAYPAAIVLLSGVFVTSKPGRRFLFAATAINFLIGASATVAAIYPHLADRVDFVANSIKRARGWEDTAREIALRAQTAPGEAPFTAVLVDDRATYYELAYYWRHARRAGEPLPPVRMWVLYADARNSAEASDPMRPEEGARVLVVHETPRYLPLVAGDFTVFRTVDHLSIPLGAARPREYEISIGEGFAPVARDDAFLQRVRELD